MDIGTILIITFLIAMVVSNVVVVCKCNKSEGIKMIDEVKLINALTEVGQRLHQLENRLMGINNLSQIERQPNEVKGLTQENWKEIKAFSKKFPDKKSEVKRKK